jgi:predicted acetyltransferase
MTFEIRSIEPAELDRMIEADERGFSHTMPADGSRGWAEAELDRTRVAFDGDEIVGVSRAYSFELTMPGGGMVPAAAVSWVSVVPTHRRRGVLTRMIDALHEDARRREEPVSMLTASESVIYGRFGYGVATWRAGISAERARVQFRDHHGDGSVRMFSRDEGVKTLPKLYEQFARDRPGAVSRPDFWWPFVFWDNFGGKDKSFFTAAHSDAHGEDDGFVAYEVFDEWHHGLPDRRLLIWDMQARDDHARAALWQWVFGIDLIGTVASTMAPIDDPLRHLVTDSRRVRFDFVNDGLWLAPFDVGRLLSSRTYTVAGGLVFEVHTTDGSSSCVALEGGPDGAQALATTAEPDIVCDAATLGACLLGGNRWSEMAAIGRVEARSARVLQQADAMFLSTPAPAMLSYF